MTNSPPPGLRQMFPNEEAPGRWIEKDGISVWQGETDWLGRHGVALVHMSHGRPIAAWGVSSDEGRLGDAELVGSECWRFWLDGSATMGTLTILPTECRVIPIADAPFSPKNAFEKDLWGHTDFRAMLRRSSFIGAAAEFLDGAVLREDGADHGRLRYDGGEASALLSRLRGWGDAAMDMSRPMFAFEAHHGVIFEEILEDLGWHALTPEEFALDHARALRLLDDIETTPVGTVPIESRPTVFMLKAFSKDEGDGAPTARLRRAMLDGRCSVEQHRRLMDLLDVEGERVWADLSSLHGI